MKRILNHCDKVSKKPEKQTNKQKKVKVSKKKRWLIHTYKKGVKIALKDMCENMPISLILEVLGKKKK